MSLVKIKASFDPSNPAQLTAAMNLLSAVCGNIIPSGNQAPADEPKEETPAPKKRAPRKKKVAEVAETPATEQPKEETPAPKKETAPTTITLEDIRTLTSKKAKDHREEIKGKLTEWGVPNVVKIPEDKYQEFIDFLNSL
jgi:outer membrane biosynthesis protein TonB